MKHVIITYSNGERFSLPASVIAEHRARHYAETDPDTTYEEEYEYTINSDYEIKDWLCDNMNYEDIQEHLKAADRVKIDYQAEFYIATKEITDSEPAINEYRERNSGSDEFPMLWDDWPSHLEPPTEEDIAFLAELDKR